MTLIVTVEVRLSSARVCEGFNQVGYVTVFEESEPAMCMCVRKNGKHLHINPVVDDEQTHATILACAMAQPDLLAETALADLYDVATPEQLASMEVNSRQRSN